MPFPDHTDRPLADLFSFSARAAVVTGGGSGIGHAICLRLAEAGASLVVADFDEAMASRTATAIIARQLGSGHRP